MNVGVLGPLQVDRGDGLLVVRGAKERALMSVLALRAGTAVSVSDLVSALWGDDPPQSARKALQGYVSNLRRLLGNDAIATTPGGYVFPADPVSVDAARFEAALANARALTAGDQGVEAASVLAEGLALWRGQPLVDLAEHPWGMAEVVRLEELRRGADEDLADIRLDLGQHRAQVAELEMAVRAEPLRERRWAQLMLALYRCDRQGDALRAFQRLRGHLGEQLGIEPSAELRGLEEAILLQKPELDWRRSSGQVHDDDRRGRAPTPTAANGLGRVGNRQGTSLEPVVRRGDGSTPARVDAQQAVVGVPQAGLVTFLFTDIEGSTERWERHPSAMAGVLEHHDRLVGGAVRAEGGIVFKTVGDAVHAVFASPVGALRAALAAQSAVAAADWREVGRLSIRIGVYTGEAEFAGGDWRGRPLNRCARLRDAARADQILASHATVELVGDDLVDRAVILDLGPRQLRGVLRGERVHEVKPTSARPGLAEPSTPTPCSTALPVHVPAALVRASRRRLIGRDRELDRLARAVTGDIDDIGVVLVAGEPGVGKTSLVAAVARSAAAAGSLVLFGRCDEGLRAPFQPFVEALSGYITQAPTATLSRQLGPTGGELCRLPLGLADRIPGLGQPTAAAPDTERWLLFEATAHLLRAVAADRRLMLVIDDLQWAEPATLLLLCHLGRAAIEGLVIVATARTSRRAEPVAFADTLADLAANHLVDTITLGGLDGDEVEALVADRMGRSPSEAFTQTVHAETGGNPFFLHELVSHLSDIGMLQASDRAWPSAVQIERSGAPEGVRHVLASRMAHLPPLAGEALLVAAVAGAEFNTVDVGRAMDRRLDDVVAALEEAAASGLIVETAGAAGSYRFAHALVRHTLYDGVSTLRRAQLHWRAAEAIRSSAGRTVPVRLNELAYHYRRGLDAGDPAVALDWLQQAGDEAVRQVAFEQAIEHYEAALAALERCPDDSDRRYRLLAGVAQSALALSDFAISKPTWVLAANIALTANDPSRFVRAVRGYAGIATLGEPDETFDLLIDQGLKLAGPGDSVERAQLLAWQSLNNVGPHREEGIQEALAIVRRLNEPSAEAAVLMSLGGGLLGSSRAEERLAIYYRVVQLVRELGEDGNEFGLAMVYRNIALAAIQLGRRPEAEAARQRGETMARTTHRRLEVSNMVTLDAAIAIAEGRYADAKPLVAHARDLGDPRNLIITLGYGAQIAAIRAEQGRAAQVIDGLKDLAQQGPTGATAWRAMLAALSADVGRLDDAAEQLEALAPNNFAVISRDWAFPLAIRYLAETCAQLGDHRRAALLLPEVEPYRGQLLIATLGTSIEAAADRSLAQLYGLVGRPDDANQHFQSAYRLETVMGFSPLAARSRYWHARLLAQTGSANDRRLAATYLAQSQATASALGMVLLERQAKEFRQQLADRHRSTNQI